MMAKDITAVVKAILGTEVIEALVFPKPTKDHVELILVRFNTKAQWALATIDENKAIMMSDALDPVIGYKLTNEKRKAIFATCRLLGYI